MKNRWSLARLALIFGLPALALMAFTPYKWGGGFEVGFTTSSGLPGEHFGISGSGHTWRILFAIWWPPKPTFFNASPDELLIIVIYIGLVAGLLFVNSRVRIPGEADNDSEPLSIIPK